MTTPKPTATITLAGLRRLTGAEAGELESMIAAGTLPALDGDRLPMVEAVQAFLHHLRDTARTASASAAMARARDARAEASELALAISRRDLVPDAEAETAADYVCGVIVDRVGGMPARVTRDLRDRRRIEETLRAAQEGIAADLASDT
ncbi:hypothetical protein H9N28_07190 [Rhodobacter capsulatus]|uniref:hypothetical protein n=1 Tax=Rhodobacter capsulatus TaxID=1061 RepID=UPI0006DC9B2E|nr:hypothetical protein [Rhodobacter capsulatus]KQB17102.1 hypothetical protein AP073_00195 [Rhodobacter capsulatus]KQB17500.1 hypothetical protein AP071_00200 [Rhodobacter capsulatus]PZX27528.1 hypothetical protein LY44_00904 [Rhodobacter capsulatus]QNR64599.1 hypothetical protein H9N28_07190 [Rhodobacter capsulatus]